MLSISIRFKSLNSGKLENNSINVVIVIIIFIVIIVVMIIECILLFLNLIIKLLMKPFKRLTSMFLPNNL